MFSRVGEEAAAIAGGKTDGLFLYAEVEEGSVVASVFMDEGDVVRYYDPTQELFKLIRQAWDASELDEAKRWVVMEYAVRGTKFDASFKYRSELVRGDYVTDRRRAVLIARYGDKPVIYPPMPENMRSGS